MRKYAISSYRKMHLIALHSGFIHEYDHLNLISPFSQVEFYFGLFV